MSGAERVLLEVVVAAPADVVWRALRDPAEIRRWFGWDYADLDVEIAFIFDEHATASDADRVLTVGRERDRFVLEPRGDRTVVRLVRSAPAGDAGWEDVYDDEVEGWTSFAYQLRFALERHLGEARRTLYLSGRSPEGTPVPAETLGLQAVAGVAEGEPYALTAATGDGLAGRVWYRSRRQVGLTVDGWGDGLLIATARPVTEKSPHGGGELLLTMYGLDDAAYRELYGRWVQWWRARYEGGTVAPEGVA